LAKVCVCFSLTTLLAGLAMIAAPSRVAQAQDPVEAVFANQNQRNRFCAGNGAGGFACSDVNTDSNLSTDVALTPLVTLAVNRGGSGTVTSDPGILCGTDCTEIYLKGTVVTLTAHPGVKSYLASWSGACSGTGITTTVSMVADKTCTAAFGYPVGGIVVPVNKLGLVASWVGLAALASLAALTVAVVRRRRI